MPPDVEIMVSLGLKRLQNVFTTPKIQCAMKSYNTLCVWCGVWETRYYTRDKLMFDFSDKSSQLNDFSFKMEIYGVSLEQIA